MSFRIVKRHKKQAVNVNQLLGAVIHVFMHVKWSLIIETTASKATHYPILWLLTS